MKLSTYLKDKSVLKFTLITFISSMSEVWSYYCSFEGMPMIILRLSMLSLFLYFSYSTVPTKFSARLYFLFIFTFMIIISLFNNTSSTPVITLSAISSMMISGTLSKRLEIDMINKSMVLLSIIFGALALSQLLTTEIDLTALLRRGYTWTELFSYAPLLNILQIIFFTSIITRRGVIISILLWLLAITLNLIFLKRMIFVDSILMLLLAYHYLKKNKKFKTAKRLLIIISIISIYIIIWGADTFLNGNTKEVMNSLKDRFSDSGQNLSSFDRLTETKNYFIHDTNVIDVIFGKGFFSSHHAFEEEKYFLHIGWFNWIFKGGILLIIGIMYIYIKAFSMFRNIDKFPPYIQFTLLYSIFAFFRMFYANYMSFDPGLFFLFYSLMTISDFKIIPSLRKLS